MDKINAVHVNKNDSCVVVTEAVKKGDTISFYTGNGDVEFLVVRDDIPIYHKVAVVACNEGDFVIKYGEHIGYATKTIAKGNHVHTHNIRPVGELRK